MGSDPIGSVTCPPASRFSHVTRRQVPTIASSGWWSFISPSGKSLAPTVTRSIARPSRRDGRRDVSLGNRVPRLLHRLIRDFEQALGCRAGSYERSAQHAEENVGRRQCINVWPSFRTRSVPAHVATGLGRKA
jgi:hypothetical protein